MHVLKPLMTRSNVVLVTTKNSAVTTESAAAVAIVSSPSSSKTVLVCVNVISLQLRHYVQTTAIIAGCVAGGVLLILISCVT
jgi:hypothetical protein